jgi:hypothetical protein
LEELKKRLPGVVAAWAKEHWYKDAVKVRLVRQIGPDEAKITLQCHYQPKYYELLTIYLRYYGGHWTTTRFDATWDAKDTHANKAVRFLMLAIDESGGK